MTTTMQKDMSLAQRTVLGFLQGGAIVTVDVAHKAPLHLLDAYDQLCKANRFLDAVEEDRAVEAAVRSGAL